MLLPLMFVSGTSNCIGVPETFTVHAYMEEAFKFTKLASVLVKCENRWYGLYNAIGNS